MINPSWARWIMASMANYFAPIAANVNLPILVDGIDDRATEVVESNHVELRVTGPFVTKQSKNCYHIYVDANLLFTNLVESENAYDLQTWCGVFQSAAQGPIDVYRWGNEIVDDQTYAFCLVPRKSKFDAIRVLHFGQIGKVDRIRQSMVDVRYEAYITTSDD